MNEGTPFYNIPVITIPLALYALPLSNLMVSDYVPSEKGYLPPPSLSSGRSLKAALTNDCFSRCPVLRLGRCFDLSG